MDIAELRKNDRSGFVERRSAGYTQYWAIAPLFDGKFLCLQYRQIRVSWLSRGGLDRGSGLRVGCRPLTHRFLIVLVGKIIREFQHCVANPNQSGLIEGITIEVNLRKL